MIEAAIAHDAAMALFLAPLLVGTAYDLFTYRIPNAVTAAMAVAFLLAGWLSPAPVAWAAHLAAGLALFVAGATLFSLRLLGGGDVKMLAAVGLWLGMEALLPLVLAVTLAGGAVTILLLVLRLPAVAGPLCRSRPAPELLSRGGRVPYALAIAAGALVMSGKVPF